MLEDTPGRTGGAQPESLQLQRYLDSNGYSLRSSGQDRGTRFRFRLKPSGASLRLEALDPQQRAPLLVGQAKISKRDPNGFVALQLEPGWALERRVYQGRQLNHLYFAHQASVNRLLALASSRGQRSGFQRLGMPMPPIAPPPLPTARATHLAISAPIRLQVIPHRR